MDKTNIIRNQFPALNQTVYGKQLIYFDNAATSQKPQSVLDFQSRMSSVANANIHRAVHKLSADATVLYEQGREAVRSFIGAEKSEEIIFTSGTTAGFNLLANSFCTRYLSQGDKIVVSEAEHHSNIVPWQLACERVGAELVVIPIDCNCRIDLESFEKALDKKVKLVSVTHISNVLGVVNPIKSVIEIAHSRGIPVAIDGAQGVVHQRVDVKELDCDFYVFSGHKIYAPTGTGILYGKKKWLEEMPPFLGGGDMVDTVTFAKTTYAPLPLKFEAGTQNFAACACYAPALEFASQMRASSEVAENESKEIAYLIEALQGIEGLHLVGVPDDLGYKIPLFSMYFDGAHPTDVAQLIDKMGIAVRSGLMCAEPLVRKYSDKGLLRASLMPYNTIDECEAFIYGLRRALAILR